jgi:hypothetical protein
MKKITQNLIQSIWRSGLLAFVFLCSLSINSQTVGQEYLVNPNINTTATSSVTGVDGSGNMPKNLGGWTDGVGGAYAPTSSGNGDCHSEDRMFKFFKIGGAAGHYVSQDVVNLPAGNFNWSFYTKWGAVVDYDSGVAEKPTFTILTDDDADGTWEVVKTIITTEPTAPETWEQQNGVYHNQIARDVRIRFHKYGANLQELMYVDDVSLTYASTFTFPVDDTSLSALTQDGSPIAGFTESGSAYDISLAQGTTVVPAIAATTNNPSANLVITAAPGIPGTTRIVVTAEDGTTTNTVSINFSIPALGVVGQEYLVNPGVNSATGEASTTPDTGVDGGGNMPNNLGGWSGGAGGAYAPTSDDNGDCHSEDRMFRFYPTNIAYVNQIIELPPGIYSWSFWTKWKGLVTWDAEGDKTPKFTISTDDDANGTWTAVQTNDITQPTAVNSWVRQTGTYKNDIQRQVRIQFYKDGSTNLNQEMYIDDVSLKFVGSNAWTGTTDTDWDTATNWSNGVPGASSEVFIPGGLSTYPTASSAVTVSSLTMGSGASLMANSDFTGAVTYNRTLATDNWYLISSPVVGQDKDAFVTASGFATGSIGSNVGFADYNNTTEAWSYYQSDTPVSEALAQGEGHSVKLAIAGDVVFTGTFNDADVVSIPVTNNTNGFNLIGNPYLASVSVSELLSLTNNSDLLSESTVWLWDQSSSSYVQKNLAADLEIAPGQAFFISANTSGSFGITESMQSHSADTFQRTVAKPEVELSLSNGKASRTASIYYIDGATTGFDNGYDSSIFGGFDNDFSLYTHAVANGTGRNLGIQSLPKGEYQNMIIPVGVIAESGSSLEFSASSENLPEGIKIFLEDREENTFNRLDALNASYKLTTESAINGVGRFYLHTNQSVLNINDASLDNVSVFKVHNSLRIVGLQQGRASVKLFNVLGRQVLNTVFESNGTRDISLPRLAKGVYIVHLETVEGALNKKIILE